SPPCLGWTAHQLPLAPAAWLPCALDRRLASASVSSKAIIAILSKTRPIARVVLLPVRLSYGQCKKARGAPRSRSGSLTARQCAASARLVAARAPRAVTQLPRRRAA